MRAQMACRERPGMTHVVGRLFTAEILERLGSLVGQKVPMNGKDVRNRHRILTATPGSSSEGDILQQAAWKMYLNAAFDCGLLPDSDLEGRLQGIDDDGFRSGLSECMTAWYMARLGFEVRPKPESTHQRNVDFLFLKQGACIHAEVKAPYSPLPMVGGWSESDTKVFLKCIKDAGSGQLKRGRTNLLVVCPTVRMPVFAERSQLIEATIGQVFWEVPVSLDGSRPPKGRVGFHQNGKLAKLIKNKQTGAFTTDFTRIGAVMTLEPDFAWILDEDRFEVTHRALVVHNPFATHRIDPDLFGDIAQWIVNGEGDTKTMGWSDRYSGP